MNVVEIEQNIKDIGLVLLESILGKKNQNLRDPVLCFQIKKRQDIDLYITPSMYGVISAEELEITIALSRSI